MRVSARDSSDVESTTICCYLLGYRRVERGNAAVSLKRKPLCGTRSAVEGHGLAHERTLLSPWLLTGAAYQLDDLRGAFGIEGVVRRWHVPESGRGDVVVMDNLARHKAPAVRAATAGLPMDPPEFLQGCAHEGSRRRG